MTETTNWVYSGTNAANGNVVNTYTITYKIPIYETALPIVLVVALLATIGWRIRKRKKIQIRTLPKP
jgi:hypothetical protein